MAGLSLVVIAEMGCRRFEAPRAGAVGGSADSQTLKALFKDPPRQYSTAPLWVWNDMLTEEQIRGTLRDLAGQNVKQVFVHPRPGLMTPYLGADWFRLWKVALDEADRLDMNIWIYDENSYPSGFAGGLVPEAMPESRGKGLSLEERTEAPGAGDEFLAVYSLGENSFENITAKIKAGEALPKGRYLVASIRLARTGGWFGGKYYVDLLRPGVTEKFIEITMEAYRRELGEHFGKRVPGWFTDEPHLSPAGGLHFTDTLGADFKKRWGYDLFDHLPSLVRRIGQYKRVRHNYYQLLLELFVDRWARPCYEYCQKHNLEFTGHYWEHGWPDAGHGGDNMAMYAWHQRPAIDTLMNRYSEDVHAQFGNVRSVLELASVANQLGRRRTLCEAYGAGGWDLRFEDMKRIGDWLYVLGVNTLDEHLSYITIRGARKRDHPQSFSYHEPWWPDYHLMASYFARLSAALSAGQQVNHILLLEPTTTAWMYQAGPADRDHLNKIGSQFQKLVTDMAKAQVEFDLGCEDIIARHGRVKGRSFGIGRRQYDVVIIAPLTENLNAKTTELLEAYVKAGGKVLCCGEPPTLVDGRTSDRGMKLAKSSGWRQVEPAGLVKALPNPPDGFRITCKDARGGILFHHRRKLADGELLFVTNTSIDSACSVSIVSPAQSAQNWDPETGRISPEPFSRTARGISLDVELAPCGSKLLFLSDLPGGPARRPRTAGRTIGPAGGTVVRRIAPNVLTLDYVDITAGGESKQNIYFYQANRFAFEKNGLGRNPWDSAVQFRDEIISRKFPEDSGFEATYKFRIEGQVPARLEIVIERADLYEITCNGKPVKPLAGQWWLDKAFGKIDISSAAREGENTVTIKAHPMTVYHELESAYVLGDFALRPGSSGYTIVPDGPLKLGPWNAQGMPFYAEGVSYTHKFELRRPRGKYYVRLSEWYGSIARVSVNGRAARQIYRRPWESDVTSLIRPGSNTVEVTVLGTLKNTLGPHHKNPPLGSAWPAMFQKAPDTGPPPGGQYSTVGYGLFEPFELINR